jgi:fructokinase
MILVIGEILFDIFPRYKQFGGAPFNFAYHLQNFGYPVRFVSRVGDDLEGKEILSELNARHFDTRGIQIDPEHPTGRVLVKLNQKGVPTFDIIKEVAYDHISLTDGTLELPEAPLDLIYFGTLMQRTRAGMNAVQDFLARQSSGTPCFYDINLRPGCYHFEILEKTLPYANILKINDDELIQLMGMFRFVGTADAFMDFLFKEYPLRLLAVTKGEMGSLIRTPTENSEIGLNPDIAIADTVGAGDAFAAMTAIGYLKGWNADKINKASSHFASLICGVKGAIPQDNTIYGRLTADL